MGRKKKQVKAEDLANHDIDWFDMSDISANKTEEIRQRVSANIGKGLFSMEVARKLQKHSNKDLLRIGLLLSEYIPNCIEQLESEKNSEPQKAKRAKKDKVSVSETMSEHTTGSTSETVSELATEPAVELTSETDTESETEPPPESDTEPETEPPPEPDTKPEAKSSLEPITESTHEQGEATIAQAEATPKSTTKPMPKCFEHMLARQQQYRNQILQFNIESKPNPESTPELTDESAAEPTPETPLETASEFTLGAAPKLEPTSDPSPESIMESAAEQSEVTIVQAESTPESTTESVPETIPETPQKPSSEFTLKSAPEQAKIISNMQKIDGDVFQNEISKSNLKSTVESELEPLSVRLQLIDENEYYSSHYAVEKPQDDYDGEDDSYSN